MNNNLFRKCDTCNTLFYQRDFDYHFKDCSNKVQSMENHMFSKSPQVKIQESAQNESTFKQKGSLSQNSKQGPSDQADLKNTQIKQVNYKVGPDALHNKYFFNSYDITQEDQQQEKPNSRNNNNNFVNRVSKKTQYKRNQKNHNPQTYDPPYNKKSSDNRNHKSNRQNSITKRQMLAIEKHKQRQLYNRNQVNVCDNKPKKIISWNSIQEKQDMIDPSSYQHFDSKPAQKKQYFNNVNNNHLVSRDSLFGKNQQKPVSNLSNKETTLQCQFCNNPIPLHVLQQHQLECRFLIECQFCLVRHPAQLIDEHYQVCQIKNMLFKKEEKKQSKKGYKDQRRKMRPSQHLNYQNAQIDHEMVKYFQNQFGYDQQYNPDHTYEQQWQHEEQYMHQQQYNGFQVPEEKSKPKGLSKQKISTIPSLIYGQLKKNDYFKVPNECPICFIEFKPEQRVLKLKCNHIFNKDCLTQWLKGDSRCPMCKETVK